MKPALSLRHILLYSGASAGLNMMNVTVATWLLYFYSPPADSGRIQYLPVTWVGILMMIGSLWNAFIDPLIGYWSDITRSRWGRRRPFLLFAAPVAAIALVMLWTPPVKASSPLNASYFLLVTLTFYTAFSLVGIPYDASLPEMAPIPQMRVTLSMWKNILGLIGILVGSVTGSLLFSTLGPLAMGWMVATASLISIWLTLGGLSETIRPIEPLVGLRENFGAVLRNQQFLILFTSTLCMQVAYAMLLANLPYFVTLVVGADAGSVSLFQVVVVALMVGSAPLWAWLGQRHANRKLLMISLLGMSLACSLNATPGLVPGFLVLPYAISTIAFVGPFLGGYFVLAYAMMGSVVDYDEMFTHCRREAVYYSTFSFTAGVGHSLAVLILPLLLQHYGYTATNPLGVRLAFLASSLLILLAALVFTGYWLGDTPAQTRHTLELGDR